MLRAASSPTPGLRDASLIASDFSNPTVELQQQQGNPQQPVMTQQQASVIDQFKNAGVAMGLGGNGLQNPWLQVRGTLLPCVRYKCQ